MFIATIAISALTIIVSAATVALNRRTMRRLDHIDRIHDRLERRR